MPQPLNDEKVTVWCGFSSDFILDPYFFEHEQNGRTRAITVNGDRYLNLLEDFVLPALRARPGDQIETLIFQQDGAPPHIYRPVKQVLQESFGNRIISRHFPNPWPARSPDLNPLDFWFWGYLKSRVFSHSPATLQDLKTAIREEISNITAVQLSDAVGNFSKRVNVLIEVEGGHFEHLL